MDGSVMTVKPPHSGVWFHVLLASGSTATV